MKTSQSLTDALNAKADLALEKSVRDAFGKVTSMLGCTSLIEHVDDKLVHFNGYANSNGRPIWPHAMVQVASTCVVEGLRKSYRERFISDFIAKVDKLESELEEVRCIAENARNQ